MMQVKSIKSIKMEQTRYRIRQNPSKKNGKAEKKKNKLKEMYWRQIPSQKE